MGVKSQKKAKTRLDAYYRLAKDQGYRARSAFKLIQLNRKYDFLAKSRVLVDLCAAPGGWCQVAAQTMPVGSKIIGVDLVPIAPIRGVKTFVGDITDDKTRKTIKTWLKKEPVDTVIHDGAPNVGGVWSKDLFAQNSLVLSATKIACELLKPGGWYVTKVFRSPDYQKLIWVFKQLFEKVEATKPLASRMESAEIFVTCAGFKAPRQLDPKLFQAQYVFSDVGEEKIMLPNGMMVIPKNNVPQGYEEFATIPMKIVSLTDFLDSTDAKALLTTQHEIRAMNDEEKGLMKSKWCKPELVFLMYDLQQVGEADRRRLLRLREQLLRERARRRLAAAEANALQSDAAPEEAPEEELEIDDEEELDDMARQLLAIKRQEERELKKKQKKIIDRKLKQVRGLINFNPNEASANAPDMYGQNEDGAERDDDGFVDPMDQKSNKKQQRRGQWGADDNDDEDYQGDYDDEEDDDDDSEDELSPIQQLGKFSEEELAAALDRYAEDHIDNDRGKHLPNIPLNSINDVHLDPDDDMDNADVLHDSDEEGDAAANNGRSAGGKKGSKKVKINAKSALEDDESDFDPNDFILDEDEDGLLDVDESGNYIRSKDPVLMEKFRVQSESKKPSKFQDAKQNAMKLKEDAAAREQEKKDKREAKLDEVGKTKSKWERRHLNVDQILRETFAKPKQQKDPKKRARLEEDLIEMGDSDADSNEDAAALGSKKKKQQQISNKYKLHDESDGSDDDDEDDDDIGDLQKELHKGDDDDDLVGDVDDDMADEDAAHLARRMLRPDAVRGDKKNKFVPKQGELTAQEQAKALRKQVERDNRKNKSGKTKSKDAFEEIPIALTDPTVRARTLALATKMLDKKTRMQTLDSSIHRYMIDDDEDLPDWFVEDEQKHYQLNLPVTAEEMAAQRARFQELNSRPSKRVMEAVGRKRKKAQRMLRGMLEKGKTDPTVRNKVQNLSIRKLMRSKAVKGGASAGKKPTRREERNNERKKKMSKYDGRTKGEQKREWDKKKRAKKSGKGRR